MVTQGIQAQGAHKASLVGRESPEDRDLKVHLEKKEAKESQDCKAFQVESVLEVTQGQLDLLARADFRVIKAYLSL